jgi:hypothetical protein
VSRERLIDDELLGGLVSWVGSVTSFSAFLKHPVCSFPTEQENPKSPKSPKSPCVTDRKGQELHGRIDVPPVLSSVSV